MSDQTEESWWTDELSNPTWISWLLCLVVLGVSGLCLFSSHFIGAEFLPCVGHQFMLTCIAGMACFYSLTEFIYPIDCERKEAERIFSELPCDIGARIDTSTFVWHRVSEQDMKDTEYQKLTAYPSENARYVKRGLRDVDGNPVSPLARLDGTETILQVVHTPNMLHEEGLRHPTFTQFAQKHAETVVAMEEAQNAQLSQQQQQQLLLQQQQPPQQNVGWGSGGPRQRAPMDNLLGASASAGGFGGGGPKLKGTPGRKRGEWQDGKKKSEADRSDYEKNRDANMLENAQVLSDLNITTLPKAGGRGGGPGSRGGRGGASAGKRKTSASHSYNAGDKVLARYRQGRKHKATILAFMHPDRYVIAWEDGDDTDVIKCENELEHDLQDAVDVDD